MRIQKTRWGRSNRSEIMSKKRRRKSFRKMKIKIERERREKCM